MCFVSTPIHWVCGRERDKTEIQNRNINLTQFVATLNYVSFQILFIYMHGRVYTISVCIYIHICSIFHIICFWLRLRFHIIKLYIQETMEQLFIRTRKNWSIDRLISREDSLIHRYL